MESKETRRQNLILLLSRYSTLEELAEKAETAANYLSDIKHGGRNMGTRLARKIEEKLGLDRGWMDSTHQKYEKGIGSFFISAHSLEELAQKLQEKGNDQVLEIIRLLATRKS